MGKFVQFISYTTQAMENSLPDITTERDIRLLIDSFYGLVNQDSLLSLIFNDHAKVDWPHHLPTMYEFWNSLLLGTMSYQGQPFPKHMVLPIQKEHFERWLQLFTTTVDALFSGNKAEEAKARAGSIARIFQYKMGLLEKK
jgi:hemoglobin